MQDPIQKLSSDSRSNSSLKHAIEASAKPHSDISIEFTSSLNKSNLFTTSHDTWESEWNQNAGPDPLDDLFGSIQPSQQKPSPDEEYAKHQISQYKKKLDENRSWKPVGNRTQEELRTTSDKESDDESTVKTSNRYSVLSVQDDVVPNSNLNEDSLTTRIGNKVSKVNIAKMSIFKENSKPDARLCESSLLRSAHQIELGQPHMSANPSFDKHATNLLRSKSSDVMDIHPTTEADLGDLETTIIAPNRRSTRLSPNVALKSHQNIDETYVPNEKQKSGIRQLNFH